MPTTRTAMSRSRACGQRDTQARGHVRTAGLALTRLAAAPQAWEACRPALEGQPNTHHALDHAPLLVVLLSKEGRIRLHDVEQLGDHGAHAPEKVGPAARAQALRRQARRNGQTMGRRGRERVGVG